MNLSHFPISFTNSRETESKKAEERKRKGFALVARGRK